MANLPTGTVTFLFTGIEGSRACRWRRATGSSTRHDGIRPSHGDGPLGEEEVAASWEAMSLDHALAYARRGGA